MAFMSKWLAAASFLVLSQAALAADKTVNIDGAQVVPPVATQASGVATLNVADDKTITAKVMLKGLSPFAAHIHVGEKGKNGPPAIWLEKESEGVWIIKPGTKMTDEQYAAYKAGNTYFQFHTDANKAGEIRGQIQP